VAEQGHLDQWSSMLMLLARKSMLMPLAMAFLALLGTSGILLCLGSKPATLAISSHPSSCLYSLEGGGAPLHIGTSNMCPPHLIRADEKTCNIGMPHIGNLCISRNSWQGMFSLSLSLYIYFYFVAAHHKALVQDPMKPQQFLNSFVMTQLLFYISTSNSMVCADIV